VTAQQQPDDPGVQYATLRGDQETGPGGTPSIKIALVAEISGEWVTPDVIAETARTLALTLAARLREAADETPR
jgi:hypothetical protein